jgi:hypothetical protein
MEGDRLGGHHLPETERVNANSLVETPIREINLSHTNTLSKNERREKVIGPGWSGVGVVLVLVGL